MRSPVDRVVVGTVVLGAVLATGCALLVGARPGGALVLTQLDWLNGPALLPGLFLLTGAGELVAVRLRHGEAVEELTLLEAAVVVDVLLLPPRWALVVPPLALATVCAARRRPWRKVAFNTGAQAAASAVLVIVVTLTVQPAAVVTARTAAGLLLGTVTFAAMNLLLLARVLGVLDGTPTRALVRDGARLSLLMAVGSLALGVTAVAVAGLAAPLLPAAALPAAALTYAFQAEGEGSAARWRSTRLLGLSQLLASRLDAPDLLAAFLRTAPSAFDAELALVVLDSPDGVEVAVLLDPAAGPDELWRVASPTEVALLHRSAGEGGAQLVTDGLPPGWTRALVAPLSGGGRRLGLVALGARSNRGRGLTAADTVLLTPLASALGAALQAGDYLRRLEQETSKLKAVVDHSSDGILVLSGGGVVQLWSPAMSVLTGRVPQAAVGVPLAQVLRAYDEDGAEVDAFSVSRAHLSPESPRAVVELAVRRPDGEQRVVSCAHAAVFVDGRLERDVVIVHDVTREREVERLKGDFIATVSHELRSPVTPIKGYADILRRKGDGMDPQRRQEYLTVISERADHLARLVEDLLLTSRISHRAEAPPLHLADADLGALVHDVVAGADPHRVALRSEAGALPVRVDPARVRQILEHLLDNAVKFSDAGTPVVVSVDREAGRARVHVRDEGRGIPADQLERIFDRFTRVEDPMRMTTGGAGLGLFLARQLARAMGGEITVRSGLGLGSLFTLELPVAAVDRGVSVAVAAASLPAVSVSAAPLAAVSVSAAPLAAAPLPRTGSVDTVVQTT